MAEIIFKTDKPEEVTELVKKAIAAELCRLENSQRLARKRLDYFEEKYQQRSPLTPLKNGGTGSSQFQDTLAAEDMEGGDIEYVEWMGEYQFFLELEEKIKSLKSLEYSALRCNGVQSYSDKSL
ncbi:hypothetical protein PMG71_09735 [Roseofilum sp. BLCC_M154]|uniref:Transposase n=1 Tax=Roseofilum acuticapitatum BLCC-M154 TaxID=3022444 RepID=A0ABT7AS25_9CYAN|nr:hypothetical protein [Roseofilum acuticapitatum]MDJ1169707.1 hypothetical protein [Roseofilum acuticapitatum BLCC-M154]